MNNTKYPLFIILIILGGITFGYNISVIASALPKIKSEFLVSDSVVSLIAGLVFAGMVTAKLFMSFFNDNYGRRKTLLISAIVFICGTLNIILAQSITYVLIGRVLQGFGGGLLMFTTSLYITEVSRDENRGKFMAIYQLSFTLGLLLANIIGFLVYNINWRISFTYLIIMAILFSIVVYLLPCSPKWLYFKNQYQKARLALAINHDIAEIDAVFAIWAKSNIHNSDKLLQKCYIRPLLIVIIITCLHQLTGINAILQTSTILITDAGLAKHSALLGSIGITLVNVIGTLIGLQLIEKIPRNKLLGICGLIIASSHLAVAINYFSGIHSSIVLIIGLMVFILSYAIGPGIIIWLVFSEYLPTPVRGKAMAAAAFINSLAGWVISSVFLDLIRNVGISWVFLICGLFSLIYGIIPLIYLPNTNNQDIEDFDNLFKSKPQV